MKQPRDARSKQLLHGQLAIGNLIVTRELSRDTSRVIYKLPLSFEIHATTSGVSLVGQSTNLNATSVRDLLRVIRWANRISADMWCGRGTIPQAELSRTIRLRTRRVPTGWRAWYLGHAMQAIERKTEAEAIASLRSIYLQLNEKH